MAEGRNEPSMDEILSSIKRIIADDDRARPLSAKRTPKDAQTVDENEILELTETAADSEIDAAAESEEVLLDDSKARSLRQDRKSVV